MTYPSETAKAAHGVLVNNIGKLGNKDQEFANSMLSQFAKKGTLSPKQWPWIEKLAARANGEVKPVVVVDCAPLIAMFEIASSKAKYPKITVKTDAGTVQLSRAGAKAKIPGSINVTDGKAYGDNKWFGRILTDGTWQMPADAPPEHVIQTVKRLSADPAGMAKKYAKVSGHCCFCNLPIGEGACKESIAVGYGPDCAKKFGLPWGGKKATPKLSEATTKQPVVVAPAPVEPEITAQDAGFNCAECMDEGIVIQPNGTVKTCTKCFGQEVV